MPENEINVVTIGEFPEMLWKAFMARMACGDAPAGLTGKDGIRTALSHGWAQPQDVRRCEEAIRRNEAARILHEFLRRELGEADEEEWEEAKKLKDLYDCRTCVDHVAQVYCKGIMPARGEVFGMRETMSVREANLACERAALPEKRRRPGQDALQAAESRKTRQNGGEESVPQRLSAKEAMALVLHKETLCVDVRTPGEYQDSHPEGFCNVPLLTLMEKPQTLCTEGKECILLGCDGGYRSEIAAERLARAGFQKVFYFGWNDAIMKHEKGESDDNHFPLHDS